MVQPPTGKKILPHQRFGEGSPKQVRWGNVQGTPLDCQSPFPTSLAPWEGPCILEMLLLGPNSGLSCPLQPQESFRLEATSLAQPGQSCSWCLPQSPGVVRNTSAPPWMHPNNPNSTPQSGQTAWYSSQLATKSCHTSGLEKAHQNRSGGAMFRVLPWIARTPSPQLWCLGRVPVSLKCCSFGPQSYLAKSLS
jgi:hypothetical protein